MVRIRAEKAGELLASQLLDKRLGARPVTLVGVSLGAKLIISCLMTLADRYEATCDEHERHRIRGIVENVVLMGAAVSIDLACCARIRV